ncbi:cupredoxin domain-containing protein [Natronolimnohabitans innermongolicus]|uniref:Blue (Type 1) copper domain-containing protein n=1 Tax=Natronolimnohabitans innermongolicus JCM 12255 TaxID=1227499 RepID=L9XM82_9EURY|nr:hypothetical protein [Natronolimnohabitans innermongolicus]ELY61778.1 hypothetical protein C493_01729 [Natronolimnohabitans innermongolicus JCM 12255]
MARTRRSVLSAAGAAAITVAAAGCLGSDDDGEEYEIDPEEDILLEGYRSYWVGLEPESIDGVENPTLVLEDGGEYTMEWINSGDMHHDLAIWDDGNDVVDDLQTDQVSVGGEGEVLEFTADPEMVTYVCTFHESSQIGDLIVE